jgi:RimJ/RimL family protein N-acetyltransferase
MICAAPAVLATAPEIETERLILRGHRVEDFADSVALWADHEVTRHIGGRPATEEETWGRLLRYVGHWAVLGFGYWAVRDKASGRFVGEAGFADYKRAIDPPLPGPEIGWALLPSASGRGLATEAVSAIVAWGDTQFGARRTVCIVSPGNTASIRVAEKCGYREERRTLYRGAPTIVFAR